ncbi:MAG: right-handed parallel beta-helix repeat-containing protein [Devosia sp.]
MTSEKSPTLHVSVYGSDAGSGAPDSPLRTIQAAADKAQPGDTVIVHGGTYREWIKPPRGGSGPDRRITYQAAEGEHVEIKGSEPVEGWQRDGSVWKVTLPDTFFGAYNPYRDEIVGDWFYDLDRVHHTGEIYLDGRPLFERASLEDVRAPKSHADALVPDDALLCWYCEHGDGEVTLWANFGDAHPNANLVEVTARPAVFYPEIAGCNFITVRGFTMRHAATQWAAPTAEQIGLIGTNWSKGWVIENNVISDSRCSGITLGKDRESGHNTWSNEGDDLTSAKGADAYTVVVQRALELGWSKDTIGSHLVQNNEVYRCEMAGICGSLGAAFSHVRGNHVHHIFVQRQFHGAEMAGIKFHAALDSLIEGNCLHHCGMYGLWLDWMTQGTRVHANLMFDNKDFDLFSEVNHGPYVVDNNILLSHRAIRDWSQGGAYVHNLIGGPIEYRIETVRKTPILERHGTQIEKIEGFAGGDARYYGNVLVSSAGLEVYADCAYKNDEKDNVWIEEPSIGLRHDEQGRYLLNVEALRELGKIGLVHTENFSPPVVSQHPYVDGTGASWAFDQTYLGEQRVHDTTVPGPFTRELGEQIIVWPRPS